MSQKKVLTLKPLEYQNHNFHDRLGDIDVLDLRLNKKEVISNYLKGKKIWRVWQNLIWRMPKIYKFGGNFFNKFF